MALKLECGHNISIMAMIGQILNNDGYDAIKCAMCRKLMRLKLLNSDVEKKQINVLIGDSGKESLPNHLSLTNKKKLKFKKNGRFLTHVEDSRSSHTNLNSAMKTISEGLFEQTDGNENDERGRENVAPKRGKNSDREPFYSDEESSNSSDSEAVTKKKSKKKRIIKIEDDWETSDTSETENIETNATEDNIAQYIEESDTDMPTFQEITGYDDPDVDNIVLDTNETNDVNDVNEKQERNPTHAQH